LRHSRESGIFAPRLTDASAGSGNFAREYGKKEAAGTVGGAKHAAAYTEQP
jgi:hypothetical protein